MVVSRVVVHPWLVVGAGPCGIIGMGAVLHEMDGRCMLRRPVCWVDPAFDCGKLSSWVDVPMNTNVLRTIGGRRCRHALPTKFFGAAHSPP
jgi:hypothetical protein